MEATFQIGPITIGLYGIMITLGVIAAITLSIIEAKRRGQATEHILNMVLLILPLGIIGARLYHVIDEWGFYSQNPALIFGGSGLAQVYQYFYKMNSKSPLEGVVWSLLLLPAFDAQGIRRYS